MTKLTRRGICYQLEHSPYSHTIDYGNIEYTFYFSSNNYLNKFIENLEENRELTSEIVLKRIKLKANVDLLADISLYSKVESRGFYITGDNNQWQRVESIQLDGVMKIKEN